MNLANRILLSLGIIILDLGVFFIPLAGLFLAYILVFNPKWFRDFLEAINGAGPDRQVPPAS